MSKTEEQDFPPRVLSDEEIELYLSGDRRDVDRMILFGLNRLAAALLPHVTREAVVMQEIEAIGGMKGIADRAAFVNSLIEKNRARARMMQKVSEGAVLYSVIGFIGFAMYVFREALATWVKSVGGRM